MIFNWCGQVASNHFGRVVIQGGGGNGAVYNQSNQTAGTANTGGGGGAGTAGNSGNGKAGGSGIVIVRYSGSQRGSGGTVTTTGGYTYHVFTSGGTFTA